MSLLGTSREEIAAMQALLDEQKRHDPENQKRIISEKVARLRYTNPIVHAAYNAAESAGMTEEYALKVAVVTLAQEHSNMVLAAVKRLEEGGR